MLTALKEAFFSREMVLYAFLSILLVIVFVIYNQPLAGFARPVYATTFVMVYIFIGLFVVASISILTSRWLGRSFYGVSIFVALIYLSAVLYYYEFGAAS